MLRIAFQQIFALLAKNTILNARHYIVTIFAILFPVGLCLFVTLAAHRPVSYLGEYAGPRANYHNDTFFDPRNLSLREETKFYNSDGSISPPTFYFLYAPQTPYAKKLFGAVGEKLKEESEWNGTIEILGFSTEKDLELHVEKLVTKSDGYFSYGQKIAGVILLNSNDSSITPKSLKYKIRLSPYRFYMESVTDEPYIERSITQEIKDIGDSYESSSFLTIQNLIDLTHIEFVRAADGKSPLKIKVQIQRFPYPEYTTENSIYLTLDAIPFVIIYSLIFIVPLMVKRVVEEKATGVREILRLMGITDLVYWAGTFLSNMVIFFIISCILIIIFCATHVQLHTCFLAFVVLMFFAAQTILFCFTLSTFFTRSTIAVVVSLIIWILSHALPASFVDPLWDDSAMSRYSSSSKYATCLLPPMSLHWAYRIMKMQEVRGADWANLTTNPFIYGHLTLGKILGMMVLSCFIYALIIWYVGAVWPWQKGIPKPYYFPFTKSYWLGQRGATTELCEMDGAVKSEYFEEENIGNNAGVVFSGLTKVFGIGPFQKVAVDSISLKIARGQITALLGLNGAGKSTTLNMLTGMLQPTQGSVRLNGYDIIRQTQQARENMGVCPQEDLLFDQLTVREHLMFYALIKGCNFRQVGAEADHIMNVLKMTGFRSTVASNLSGGGCRKLSLAIAFIGGTKILVLDEPTSGLDPEGKRVVWDALKAIREDRTIILTTHSMEEADALSDRIAIMSRGVIQCCGSPMFLRKKFGAGYYLRVAKGPHCRTNQVIDLIQRRLPNAQVENHSTTDLIYSLGVKTSEKFGDLFEELEQREKDLGIVGYGVTVTTMEDVFLKVSQMDEMAHSDSNGHMKDNDSSSLIDSGYANTIHSAKLSGFQKTLQVYRGLFLKRMHYAKRHWILLIFQLLIPFAFLAFVMWMRIVFAHINMEEEWMLPLDVSHIFGSTKTVSQTDYSLQMDPYVKAYQKAAAERDASTTQVDNIEDYILEIGKKNIESYRMEYLVGSSFMHKDDGTLFATAWFNGEALHTRPLSLNLVYSAFLKSVANDDNASIEVIQHPFSEGIENKLGTIYYAGSSMGAEGHLLFLTIGMSFLVASYIFFPIHERATKAKHLQLMTGMRGYVFWTASFFWDFLVHIFISIIFVILEASISQMSEITRSMELPHGAIYLLLLLYGWSSIPLAYILSHLFTTQAIGFVVYNAINIILGFAFFIIQLIEYRQAFSRSWGLRLLPTFSWNWGYLMSNHVGAQNGLCHLLTEDQLEHLCPVASNNTIVYGCCKEEHCKEDCLKWENALEWDIAGLEALMLFVDGVIFWAILILIEKNIFYQLWYKVKDLLRRRFPSLNVGVPQKLVSLTEDSDVMEERNRAEQLAFQPGRTQGKEQLIVTNLTKKFLTNTAVDHLSFTVQKEECFGLLGINGAGKTTTFRMLTGDLVVTEGDAQINGYSLKECRDTYQSFIGYCPQEDSHLDRLTGREMLYLFARIRGIQEAKVATSVDTLVQMVGLDSHADKLTRTYSGGTRRKLSVALALIGCPPMLLLDEPTCGVDPTARRKIWDTLNATKQMLGTSIILTSHSMDECEALCTRLSIMVNGQFRCFGGMQYLKSKFGQGFAVVVKLQKGQEFNAEAKRRLNQFMESSLKDAYLKGDHQGVIHYHITDPSTKISHLFRTMERAKNELKLDDYLISDTSLEQIFLAFARSQHSDFRTLNSNFFTRTLRSICPSGLPCL